MIILRDYINVPPKLQNSVIVLGNFDGMHLGHQALLSKAKSIAAQSKLPLAIMTFEPHPVTVLAHKKDLRICSFKDKMRLLGENEVDVAFVMRFNQAFAEISAKYFLEEILIKNLKVKHIVTGHDFIFGKNRQGDSNYLHIMSKKLGFGFTQITPQKYNQEVIFSSSAIRKFLNAGNVKFANKLLGHKYSISGKVLNGERRGNKLGFPTANLSLQSLLRPKFGVYAVRIEIGTKTYDGVANIGIRPSFATNGETIEIHIFNFSNDIYGKEIRVEFIDFIRDEQKFTNIEDLKTQIKQDIITTKAILKNDTSKP
jgi:riboflavin kinase/FMN adenylyltransferase